MSEKHKYITTPLIQIILEELIDPMQDERGGK